MKNPVHSLLFSVALSSTVAVPLQAAAQSAEAGAKKAAMCIGCHAIPGYQASFPEIYKVPMIAGQGAPYLAASLAQYKKGERKHPTMRAIAASLTDQDMADLAAYYATQGGAAASVGAASSAVASAPAVAAANVPADIAALLAKGACASCHGASLGAPIDPSYPKLAGQHADYLYYALKAYKTTDNPKVGRANPIMAGMALPYTLAELKRLSGYIATLPSELKTVAQPPFR